MQIIQASTLQISTDICRYLQISSENTKDPCLRDAKSTAQKISMVMRQLEKVCTTASSDVRSMIRSMIRSMFAHLPHLLSGSTLVRL